MFVWIVAYVKKNGGKLDQKGLLKPNGRGYCLQATGSYEMEIHFLRGNRKVTGRKEGGN